MDIMQPQPFKLLLGAMNSLNHTETLTAQLYNVLGISHQE